MGRELSTSGYDVTILLGVNATRDAILQTSYKAAQDVGVDGLLVLHFAGHGDLDKGVAYLIPVACNPNLLELTAIRLEDAVTRYWSEANTGVALLDCCHSGGAVGMRARGKVDVEAQTRAFLDQA